MLPSPIAALTGASRYTRSLDAIGSARAVRATLDVRWPRAKTRGTLAGARACGDAQPCLTVRGAGAVVGTTHETGGRRCYARADDQQFGEVQHDESVSVSRKLQYCLESSMI